MKEFFYVDDSTREQQGPFLLTELVNKDIKPETLVWHAGMANWDQAQNIEDLAPLFIEKETVDTDTPLKEKAGEDISTKSVEELPVYNEPVQEMNVEPQYKIEEQEQSQSSYTEINNSTYGSLTNMPKTWFLESVLATLFFCIPFGVIAIVYACQVETFYNAGLYDSSHLASERAKRWTKITAIVGIIFWITSFIFSILRE